MSSIEAIKRIKDERNIDKIEFRNYLNFAKYVRTFSNKFLNKLAWSRYPNKLSLKKLRSAKLKLIKNFKTLKQNLKSANLLAENRLRLTKSICNTMMSKLKILSNYKAYSLNYKKLSEHWEKYDSFKAKGYPSNVIF